MLGVWAAPGSWETLQKGGGLRPPIFLEGFPAARSRPDPQNRRYPVGQKIIYQKPRCTSFRADCFSRSHNVRYETPSGGPPLREGSTLCTNASGICEYLKTVSIQRFVDLCF